MKIAILSKNSAVFKGSFLPLARKLALAGHTVCAFYGVNDPVLIEPLIGYRKCEWWEYELTPLEEFNPDRVVIFNGSFNWCHAATDTIRERWPVRYVELGWLPQANYSYMDPIGPGGRSSIAKQTFADRPMPPKADLLMKLLRSRYAARPREVSFPKDFILVPMQIEDDTSIVYDSPHFKSMSCFYGFVYRHFSDHPIVVKQHPLSRNQPELPGAIVAPPWVTFSDLVPMAKAVVGINSTTLIESLVHDKPIAALGYNVASNKGVFLEPEIAFHYPRAVLDFKPDEKNVKKCLTTLRGLQYKNCNPPQRVLDLITS